MANTKFKVGDKVKVKEGLIHGNIYNGCYFDPDMTQYIGKVAYITESRNSGRGDRYTIDICTSGFLGNPWYWSNDMLEPAPFTKDDLKDGMVVEDRDEARWLVLGDILIDDCRRRDFDEYDDALISKTTMPGLDIVKVYSVKIGEVYSLDDLIYDDDCLELIWERGAEEHKEMTVEEIEKKLGYKIKVVADK